VPPPVCLFERQKHSAANSELSCEGRRAFTVYKIRIVPGDKAMEFIRSLAFVEIPTNPIGAIQMMLDTV
jgi:hypothetical protein